MKQESKKWAQKAVPASHKGMLHTALHVPQGQPIPRAKLVKAAHSPNPHMEHMARFDANINGMDIGASHMQNMARARAGRG